MNAKECSFYKEELSLQENKNKQRLELKIKEK